MGGLHGVLLDVDLSRNRLSDYRIPGDWARLHLGGKGIAARILLEEFGGGDALSPDNVLVFMTGPLTGLNVPGSGRHVVVASSPLTGFYGEAYAGGFFGTELKLAGYDGLIFRGRAEEPSYLTLTDGQAELHRAGRLWGRTTGETEEMLRKRHGDVKVSSIGPAGENLVRFAAIINDRNRASGRCGVGAVMGSKNLKAVAVKGNQRPEAERPKEFAEARKRFAKTLTGPEGMRWFGKYGTAGGIGSLNAKGILPTRNFGRGEFPSWKKITGETLHDTILVDRDTCTACPVRCKRVVGSSFGGQKVVPEYGGPEYETVASFGSTLEVSDLRFISLMNQKCNALGLDTISTGVTLAFATELSEKGLLKGFPGRWGRPESYIGLPEKVARRRGVGDLLAEGTKRISKRAGGAGFAMHVKGMEVPMHEPRGKKALGISYATSPRGASHLEGLHDTMIEKATSPELGIDRPLNRLDVGGKAFVAKQFEDARAFTNSLIMCVFVVSLTGKDYSLGLVREMANAAIGRDMDAREMLLVGERNYNLGRLFACSQGLRAKDDDLPGRFKREPLPFGERRERISKGDLTKMVREYYSLRGWDRNGRPTKKKLRALGIG